MKPYFIYPLLLLPFLALWACRETGPRDEAALNLRLLQAVAEEDKALVDSCLQAGANPNSIGSEGAPPIIVTANNGNTEIAHLLLKEGADADMPRAGFYGSTALMEAAVHNDTAIGKLLLQYDAGLHRRDTFGDPAINWAAYYGHVEYVALLLDHGASWEIKGQDGSALDIAAQQWHLSLLHFLAERGAGEHRGSLREASLLEAVRTGSTERVAALLAGGANPNHRSPLGTPVLAWAAATGREEIAGMLIDKGARLNEFTRSGQSPLAGAARFGHLAVAELLLQAGADPDAAGPPHLLAPLHNAALGGHAACGKLLLDAGAGPDVQDNDGYTPLMYATSHGHADFVELLIRYRANPYIKAKDGTGLYELVSYSADPEISRMIEAYMLNRQ